MSAGGMRRGLFGLACVAVLGLAALLGASGPAAADTGCANGAIRDAQRATYLPDCRAYELASPANKNSTDVGWNRTRASLDGSKVAFVSTSGFGDAQAAALNGGYLASRSASGWTTTGLMPPLAPATQSENIIARPLVDGFNPDLSKAAVQAGPPGTPGSPLTKNIYVRDSLTGEFELATVNAPLTPQTFLYKPFFAGASNSFDHVFIQSSAPLTADGTGFATKAYEYSGGALTLAGLIPPVGSVSCGGSGPACIPAPSGSAVGPTAGASTTQYAHDAVSEDGTRAFFTAPPTASGQLYVRKNGTETVQVSASQRATPDPNGVKPALFWAASTDGRYVFFTSSQALTEDATTGPTSTGTDLYRFDTQSGDLIDVSVDVADANGAEVQGVLGASDDGSAVYFAAKAQLVPGKGTAGSGNIYLWEGGDPIYVATVGLGSGIGDDGRNNWSLGPVTPGLLASRVTPDGSSLLFSSRQDNPSTQIYLYNAGSEGITCVSCAPEGGLTTGQAELQAPPFGPFSRWTYVPRNISDDGSRIAFETTQALVGEDVDSAVDVYMYEDGTARLISFGAGKYESHFGDMSPSGDDVFFATRNRLTGYDGDGSLDIYNASVEGGFPEPPTEAQPCQAEACQGALTVAPAPAAAASASVAGAGNAKVKRQHAKKKPKKKSQHKKQSKKGKANKRNKGKAKQHSRVHADHRGVK